MSSGTAIDTNSFPVDFEFRESFSVVDEIVLHLSSFDRRFYTLFRKNSRAVNADFTGDDKLPALFDALCGCYLGRYLRPDFGHLRYLMRYLEGASKKFRDI